MVSSVSSADGVVDGTSSVDESKTRSSMPEKDEQNMAWVTNPTLHSYSLTWNNVTLPSLYLFGGKYFFLNSNGEKISRGLK